MSIVTALARWIGRKGLLFVALVAALIAYQMIRPSYDRYRDLSAQVQSARVAGPALDAAGRDALTGGERALTDAHRLGVAQIDARLGAARQAQADRAGRCGSDLGAALRGGAAAVIDNRRACFEQAAIGREISVLTELRATADARRPGESVEDAITRHVADMRAAAAEMRRAAADMRAARSWQDAFRRNQQREAAAARYTAAQARAERARGQAERLVRSRERMATAEVTAQRRVAEARAAFERLAVDRAGALRRTYADRLGTWSAQVGLPGILRTAAWLLMGIILMPYAIRLFCWFVLAPLAMRRPSIRLRVPGGGDRPIPLPDRSGPSVAVRLSPGEELLVRQSFLQSTSVEGTKATRWLLDTRHPLTSIASGLSFLTRLRGDGGATTVSATADPFAEVAILTLPDGAACVVQPRALAAVAEPIGRPLRITSHWRLFSLNAWLTLQLRFLVFHGPARLVLKGGRGVRVERAEAGRVFGSDQLIGFSADLSYAVTRSETFWPYFLGRESLLKDRVQAGAGVLIVEEAPLGGRRGAGPRRGIEELVDAGLKAFGL
ncbi:uncharacterized protein (AIM24 family) [Sphingomonas jejuensis]|uniref:Uncharacterized protein (AIM24 family) n=1 Tax=Sphingomonas jejuensis TaxID=904715 RepID=A0ABX0XNJ0_9SPHN|nr:hypothetical protein [Sphingomonas jejuensis]NJC34800.1 uncharacterized protein (AIM24 family) [Sphingomonas jejuensis]